MAWALPALSALLSIDAREQAAGLIGQDTDVEVAETGVWTLVDAPVGLAGVSGGSSSSLQLRTASANVSASSVASRRLRMSLA
jgi:hypothetical protein